MPNPFLNSTAKPGHGSIHLALLPPSTPRLKTASYQYPLKLVSPVPVRAENEASDLIYTVYLLTYGGGLVAGDAIDLNVTMERSTRLVLLTQGSTKLFKSPSRDVMSKQFMNVDVAPSSGLCYLPDPVQPFENSCFEQQQIYNILLPDQARPSTGSLCVLDWVSNGRSANGENWSFCRYGSRNEIYLSVPNGKRTLLLRDNVILENDGLEQTLAARMNDLSVFGTLMLYGPLFQGTRQFFMDEFQALARIGGRKWDNSDDYGDEDVDATASRRAARQKQETLGGLIWSAASVRGCVVVKFGAREVESGRRWLRSMLEEDGTVRREFGERGLLCIR